MSHQVITDGVRLSTRRRGEHDHDEIEIELGGDVVLRVIDLA
jgi:hypothetical protein